MKRAHERLAAGDTGDETQKQQAAAADMLAVLIDAAKAREAASQNSSGSGQGQQQSPGSQSASQSQSTPGEQPGTGSKQDDQVAAQRMERPVPQSPWSKLRDRERDPVYNAIKERFPARYQQLLEQYYRSFQESPER